MLKVLKSKKGPILYGDFGHTKKGTYRSGKNIFVDKVVSEYPQELKCKRIGKNIL